MRRFLPVFVLSLLLALSAQWLLPVQQWLSEEEATEFCAKTGDTDEGDCTKPAGPSFQPALVPSLPDHPAYGWTPSLSGRCYPPYLLQRWRNCSLPCETPPPDFV